MRRIFVRSLLVVPAIIVAACNGDAPVAPSARPSPGELQLSKSAGPTSFVLDFTGALPSTIAADVASAGGTLTARMDSVGVAVATSTDPGFRARAKKIAGISSVSPDLVKQWIAPKSSGVLDAGTKGPTALANVIGSQETFRAIQWNVDAISAPAAWTAGYQGDGARVAVIDGGIYSNHIDIHRRIDFARSASFVPGYAFNQDTGTFWHATHVAGIVAAEAQGIGTVGVAPKATIIGLKALHNGSGAFSWIINAIYYAATPIAQGGAGANIINMSLGAVLDDNEDGVKDLKKALDKATTFAWQHGVTVIASAGNDAADMDHTSNTSFVPAQSKHVIAVSATGPVGFALGATNYDTPSSYTNFGKYSVTFAGPGGNDQLPGNDVCGFPILPSGSGAQFCWVLDLVIAPCRGGPTSISSYCWAEGTSMASPAVAGVAALIVGKYGAIKPQEVEKILRKSADDLGPPGPDDYYGQGRVNAYQAVQ